MQKTSCALRNEHPLFYPQASVFCNPWGYAFGASLYAIYLLLDNLPWLKPVHIIIMGLPQKIKNHRFLKINKFLEIINNINNI